MTETIQLPSHVVKESTKRILEQVDLRVDAFGFTVWPLYPDPEHGIPAGFTTIGFTKIGVPEFYISGIAPHSDEASAMIDRLRELYQWCNGNVIGTTSHAMCNEVNQEVVEQNIAADYHWRPVDPVRMMWGQCLTLRHWAESKGLMDLVQGIQIVRRNNDNQFPMESTPEQLLLDWIPFGATPYKPLLEALKDVTSVQNR